MSQLVKISFTDADSDLHELRIWPLIKKKILNFVSLTSVFTEGNEAHVFCSGLFTNNTRTLNQYCVYMNERCVKTSEEQFCGYTVYLKTTRCNPAQQHSCEAGRAPGSVPTRRGGSGAANRRRSAVPQPRGITM